LVSENNYPAKKRTGLKCWAGRTFLKARGSFSQYLEKRALLPIFFTGTMVNVFHFMVKDSQAKNIITEKPELQV
jgi:hypothetical protein